MIIKKDQHKNALKQKTTWQAAASYVSSFIENQFLLFDKLLNKFKWARCNQRMPGTTVFKLCSFITIQATICATYNLFLNKNYPHYIHTLFKNDSPVRIVLGKCGKIHIADIPKTAVVSNCWCSARWKQNSSNNCNQILITTKTRAVTSWRTKYLKGKTPCAHV